MSCISTILNNVFRLTVQKIKLKNYSKKKLLSKF